VKRLRRVAAQFPPACVFNSWDSLTTLTPISNHTIINNQPADVVEWAAEAARLGLGEPIAISATAGEGLADLYQQLRPLVDEAAAKTVATAAAAAEAAALRAAAAAGGELRQRQLERRQRQRQGADEDRGAALSGWAARHHLSSEELAQLTLLREAEGVVGDADDEEDLEAAGDLDSDQDLEEFEVTEDGSIVTVSSSSSSSVTSSSGSSEKGGGEAEEKLPEGPLRVALMGAPNAGKSTMMNALLGWERALTGEGAGVMPVCCCVALVLIGCACQHL
jgi:predicted GTPase